MKFAALSSLLMFLPVFRFFTLKHPQIGGVLYDVYITTITDLSISVCYGFKRSFNSWLTSASSLTKL